MTDLKDARKEEDGWNKIRMNREENWGKKGTRIQGSQNRGKERLSKEAQKEGRNKERTKSKGSATERWTDTTKEETKD